MTEERIIPEVQSVAEFRISIGGEEIPRTVEVVAVHVSKVINKISMARFVIKDGDASKSDFVLSKGDLFIPGNEVEITAGSFDKQESIFKGVIVKQSISVRGNKSSQLIIDCRHAAVKSTIVRRSNCYHDMTDDSAISEALQASGLSTNDLDLEATTVTHSEMVQYNCTDWDFAVSRAEMNGKIILTNDEKVTMKAPAVTASGTLSLLFGATIIELDAEMDSRTQYKAVKASSWDMATQELAEANGQEPDAAEWGNLDGSTLGDAMAQEEYLLQHGGALIADEIQSWADAQLLKSRLARIRGRVKFEGISAINAGDVLELHGLGDRFNGNAFVTGVRHDYSTTEGWKTQAQFGNTPDWFIEQPDVVAPKAAGLLPGAIGLHTGIVTDNEDPDGEFRVRVKIPFINPDDDGVWARVALTDAGNERGMYFRPEVDDEVLLGFLYDDPRQPVILGMLHSSALPSPLKPSNDNHQKGYTSREKLVLLFDDEKKEVKIETPGGNKVTISDDKKGIVMEDQNGNSITMNDKGIVIDSASAIEIKAAKDLKLTGLTASMSGDSSMEIKSSGTGKLESSATLTIKGAMVNIN